MSSSNNVSAMAAARYPNNFTLRQDYARALEECRTNPAYYVRLPSGDMYPCHCEPFMPDDTKGWTTVKRKIHVKRTFTDEELDAEEDTSGWDDIVHQGRVTYTQSHGYEHNGSLFDIGSRF
jgi:hypothetical protein